MNDLAELLKRTNWPSPDERIEAARKKVGDCEQQELAKYREQRTARKILTEQVWDHEAVIKHLNEESEDATHRDESYIARMHRRHALTLAVVKSQLEVAVKMLHKLDDDVEQARRQTMGAEDERDNLMARKCTQLKKRIAEIEERKRLEVA